MSFDEDFKPICHGSPRPLVELASMKRALNVWLEKFNEFYKADNNSNIKITKLDFHIEESTAIPTKIRKMIDAQMYLIPEELDKWARYINLSFDQIRTRFNLVVLGGNGTVHYRDTISNYLEDESLDTITRFKIACFNCEEEKIDFFWPLVSSTLRIDELNFDNDCMMYYWICRKKGELDRIPLETFSYSEQYGCINRRYDCIERFSCIERRMIYECHSFSMHFALEYFLKSLNSEDRFVELDKILHLVRNETITRLIPNMDGPVQCQILDKYTTRILTNFVVCSVPVEYAVQCFIYISKIITPECYYHVIILKCIKYLDLYSYSKARSKKKIIFKRQQIEIIMEQIWLNAPQHLKEHALRNLSIILDEYNKDLSNSFRNFGRDMRFLLAVLSDCDFSVRNNLWIKYWRYWVCGVSPCQFEELLGLCLKSEAIEEFRSTLPYDERFQRHCDMLISGGYFIDFDEFLNRFYSNSELVLNIKKNILTHATSIFKEEHEIIDKYVNYIDNLFSDVVSADDFKTRLICSDPIVKVLVEMGTSSCDFGSVKYIVFSLVSPPKYAEVKNKFLESFRDTITRGELERFNGSAWSEFLMWCSDSNEQRVDDFTQ